MARILIADDALVIRTVLRRTLAHAGHTVVGEAATGEEAVERYLALRPDVMTLDVSMPGLGGIEALRSLVEQLPAACVVVCTVLGRERTVLEAVEAGAQGFVTKPVRAEPLLQAIDLAQRRVSLRVDGAFAEHPQRA